VKEEFDFIEELNLLARELLAFRSNDLLVNFETGRVFPWEGTQQYLSNDLQKLLKESDKTAESQGINPLCLSEGVIKTSFRDKEIACPVFLYYVTPTLSVLKEEVQWKVHWDTCFINPFLKSMFKKDALPYEENVKTHWTNILEQAGCPFDPEVKYLGNFHPYRYALLKDISGLIEGDKGKKLDYLFSNTGSKRSETNMPNGYLFGVDASQNEALKSAFRGHTVVQGPPGTGKSQLIGNLIGKALIDQKNILVCAQKKQALEVILAKLKTIGLDDFCLLKSVEAGSKSVIKSLENSWKKLEGPTQKHPKESSFEPDIQKVQNLLTLYHTEGLIGRHSPKQFLAITGLNPQKKHAFVSGTPSFDQWEAAQKTLNSLPENVLVSLGFLNFTGKFETAYAQVLAETEKLIDQLNRVGLQTSTFSAIREKYEHAQLVHTYGSELSQKCLGWMPKWSKIEKLQRKRAKATLEIDAFVSQSAAWNMIPSCEELAFLSNAFQQKGLFSGIKKSKLRKTWLRTTEVDVFNLIEKTQAYHEHVRTQHTISQAFVSLGFLDLATELPLLNAFKAMYHSENFKVFSGFSEEDIHYYRTHFTSLNFIYQALKTTYYFAEKEFPHALLSAFLGNFNEWVSYLKTWDFLPPEIRQSFRRYPTKDKLAQAIASSEWSRFIIENPSFVPFAREGILPRISEFGLSLQKEAQAFAAAIEYRRKERFEEFHYLMGKPNHKLNAAEKALKRSLVLGKRILIKAFNRQRNFPSVRVLMDGDAKHWIQLLKPVWLSSPLQLAEDLPLDPSIFDFGVFDEASQIPLSHALGAMYRCEKILVSGDSQQMPPIQFFRTGALEQVSLLDHSTYFLPNFHLNFHYRSEQPELIAFSNKHFYNDSLMAFPSYPKKASLFWHYLEEGIYENSTNEKEADYAVQLLKQTMKLDGQKIGLVTFSEKQLQSILKKFTLEERMVIAEKTDKELFFMKTLDQVQGDECDEIIISFGYGFNSEGKFEMRFGPLNLESGRKRLNVLFSRARKKIHFIASVRGEDFPISTNESIRLLTKWFEFVGEPKEEVAFSFPLAVQYQVQKNQLDFNNVADISPSVFDLISMVSVLAQRGWKIKEAAVF